MDTREVAAYLRTTATEVERMIIEGVPLPRSSNVVKLKGEMLTDGRFHVEDRDLDCFQQAFEAEEPGRRPPTWVMRKLRIEAGHSCGICRLPLPPQFHHILEWSRLKHYDPVKMLAVCGGCHDRIGQGQIDRQEQLAYKKALQMRSADLAGLDARFQSLIATARASETFAAIISDMSSCFQGASMVTAKQFEYVGLPEKNALNHLSNEFFQVMLHDDDIHVAAIDVFFKNPANRTIKHKYLDLCGKIRQRLTEYEANGLPLEYCLLKLQDTITEALSDRSDISLRSLQSLISFMYLNCDIGRKR